MVRGKEGARVSEDGLDHEGNLKQQVFSDTAYLCGPKKTIVYFGSSVVQQLREESDVFQRPFKFCDSIFFNIHQI